MGDGSVRDAERGLFEWLFVLLEFVFPVLQLFHFVLQTELVYKHLQCQPDLLQHKI